jgi:transposase
MEACVGTHHLSRQLLALGHHVKLVPGSFVKPFLQGQKNDLRDAEAVAEAVQRPTMRFVPTKWVDQLDLRCCAGFVRAWSASAPQNGLLADVNSTRRIGPLNP